MIYKFSDYLHICAERSRCGNQQRTSGFVATMQIFLRTVTATWTFVVEPTDTVESLVKQVESTRGIPACYIVLYFAGVRLDPDRTLADYGIPKESTLMMIARMAGG